MLCNLSACCGNVRFVNRPADHCPCTAGGLGDLGSLIAAWLAQTTPLHVFLLGRSGRSPKRGASRWMPPAGQQACVSAIQCDIGRAEDVADLLVRVAAAGPLQAIVHAGGALQDGTIGRQDVKSIRNAFAGKLQVCLALFSSLMRPLAAPFCPSACIQYRLSSLNCQHTRVLPYGGLTTSFTDTPLP